MLREVGLQVPMDNPLGVYNFKVMHLWDRSFYRIIAMLPNQTLEDIHEAIQRAINWDNDHLYSFFMDGVTHDKRYEIPCPELIVGQSFFGLMPLTSQDRARDMLSAFGLVPANQASENGTSV